MPAPPLYLDECVHPDLAEALRKQGFSVASTLEEGRAGRSDGDQLAYATSQGRVIVTYNGWDFEQLHRAYHQQGRSHGGIIALPQRAHPLKIRTLRLTMMLAWIIGHAPDPRNQLFRWGHFQQLIEKGYIPPGHSEEDVRLVRLR